MTALVDDGAIGAISITGIVERAGVSRPTFYQHFPDIASGVRAAAFERLTAAFPADKTVDEAARASPEAFGSHVAFHVQPVLEHLLQHRTFYVRVMDEAGGVDFFDDLVGFIAARLLPDVLAFAGADPGEAQRDLSTLMAGGLMWLVVRWVREPGDVGAASMAMRVARTSATILFGGGRKAG